MKNFTLLLTTIAIFTLNVNAQLQNGGFEDWTTTSNKLPDGFNSSANEAIQGRGGVNVTQVSPGHNSNYALKMETQIYGGNIFAAYIMTCPNDPMSGIGGFPYSQKPDSLFLYAKYGIIVGDTAIILISFKKNAQVICQNVYKFIGNSSEWKRLAFKVDGLPQTPDSIIFAMSSSNAITNEGMQVGSYVIVDNLSFNTTQPFPEGSFEAWSDYTVNTPNNWIFDSWNPTSNTQPITRSTDAHSGDYAIISTTVGDLIDGRFVTGFNNGNDHNNGKLFGGTPCISQKGTLSGWYKYFPIIENDTATAYANFYKNGHQIGNQGIWLFAKSEYTKFEFNYDLGQIPDTVTIGFQSSNWPWWLSNNGQNFSPQFTNYMEARLGSKLYVDDIILTESSSNITPAKNTSFSLSPNPAREFIKVTIPNNNGYNNILSICDNTGQRIKTAAITADQDLINVSNLNPGFYIVTINSKNCHVTQKLIIEK